MKMPTGSIIATMAALVVFACAAPLPTRTGSSTVAPRAAEPKAPAACGSMTLTVVVTGEEKEIPQAADRIAAAFRERGFGVNVETPKTVIGNWIGTYVVPSEQGCEGTECAASLNRILRSAGFHPGENPKSNTLPTPSSCGFEIYVGYTPYAEGKFILY